MILAGCHPFLIYVSIGWMAVAGSESQRSAVTEEHVGRLYPMPQDLAMARGFMVPRLHCMFHVLFVELIPLWRYRPPPFPPHSSSRLHSAKEHLCIFKTETIQRSLCEDFPDFWTASLWSSFDHTNLGLKLDPLIHSGSST